MSVADLVNGHHIVELYSITELTKFWFMHCNINERVFLNSDEWRFTNPKTFLELF